MGVVCMNLLANGGCIQSFRRFSPRNLQIKRNNIFSEDFVHRELVVKLKTFESKIRSPKSIRRDFYDYIVWLLDVERQRCELDKNNKTKPSWRGHINKILKSCEKRWPNDYKVYITNVLILLNLGFTRSAFDSLQRGLAFTPSSDFYMLACQRYQAYGEFNLARKTYL